MRIVVNFSGLFRLVSGIDQDICDISDGCTLAALIDSLMLTYDELPLNDAKTRFVVNEKVSDRATVLKDGDHVLVFQALAGG